MSLLLHIGDGDWRRRLIQGMIDHSACQSSCRSRSIAVIKRGVCVLTLVFPLQALANPKLAPILTNAYISSEKLIVTISPTEANFHGTFRFKVPGEFPKWKRWPPQAGIAVPIWFPETNSENSSVEDLWRVLRRGGHLRPDYLLMGDMVPAYEKAIGLKVYVGENSFSLRGFQTTPREFDTPDRTYLGLHIWREVQEPGFHILRFQVELSPPVFTNGLPVDISYHQPLLNVDGNRRFVYAPILEHLPPEVVSTDTNAYAIRLEATPGCRLVIEQGNQSFTVGAGEGLTLSPKHFQAIRALVTPTTSVKANEQ